MAHRTDTAVPAAVSIGMPVYNGEKYIREALDSLLGQSFTGFELIISDNASTDGTEAICQQYAAKDSRIRYVRQPVNLGALDNFTFVLDEARGGYFMWAAADDRYDGHGIGVDRQVVFVLEVSGHVIGGGAIVNQHHLARLDLGRRRSPDGGLERELHGQPLLERGFRGVS